MKNYPTMSSNCTLLELKQLLEVLTANGIKF